MRNPSRIPIIWDKIKGPKGVNNFIKILEFWSTGLDSEEIDTISHNWSKIQKNVKESQEIFNFWENNPDLRLSQVLIHMNIIPKMPGFWYYMEDENLMIETGILKPEEIFFWGQRYSKDGKELPEIVRILIKDMDSSHIEAILRDVSEGKYKISDFYLDAFTNVLNQK